MWRCGALLHLAVDHPAPVLNSPSPNEACPPRRHRLRGPVAVLFALSDNARTFAPGSASGTTSFSPARRVRRGGLKAAWELFDEPARDGAWSDEETVSSARTSGPSISTFSPGCSGARAPIWTAASSSSRRASEEPFSPDEIVTFKRLYGTRSDEDLSLVFGRQLALVKETAKQLCLSKDKVFLRRPPAARTRRACRAGTPANSSNSRRCTDLQQPGHRPGARPLGEERRVQGSQPRAEEGQGASPADGT